MNADDQEASELIRNGRYFEQARQWYTALYIGPISERSIFLGLGVVALLVAILGFSAVVRFMPLTERPGLMISNARLFDTVPNLIRLREKGGDLNEALQKYFVSQYVFSREGYLPEVFTMNNLFVMAHSEGDAATQYAAAVSASNPNNPVATLGVYGKRAVQINSVNLREGEDFNTAVVRFSTETSGVGESAKSQWTATIQFYYSDAVVTETTDPATGEMSATMQEPVFQVVSYALTQTP